MESDPNRLTSSNPWIVILLVVGVIALVIFAGVAKSTAASKLDGEFHEPAPGFQALIFGEGKDE